LVPPPFLPARAHDANVLVFGLVTVSMFEPLHAVLIGARLFRHSMALPIAYFQARCAVDTVARVCELVRIPYQLERREPIRRQDPFMMQVDEMRRLSAGSAAATWSLAAPAQQPTMPVIGYIGAQSPAAFASRVRAFRQGLGETGWRGSKCRNRISMGGGSTR
jgi:hypothetical protein